MKIRFFSLIVVVIYMLSSRVAAQNYESESTFDFSFYLFGTIALLIFFYSLIKLIRPKPEALSEKMKCPSCKEEPFKVFKWTNRIGIGKFLNGFMRCVNCNAQLKRYYSKLTWGSLFVFCSSYLIMLIPLFDPTNELFRHDTFLITYMVVAGLGFVAFIVGVLSTTITTRFLEVEE